jgi:hypothetical protein
VSPFQAKGERPEWRVILEELLEPAQIDDVITYDQFEEALGRDLRTDRGPLYRAQRKLEERKQRTIRVEPNKGYRVIKAHEHMDLALHHKSKAGRQLRRGVEVLDSADRRALTAPQARVFDKVQVVLANHELALATLEARQNALEGMMRIHDRAMDDQAERLEQQSRLAREHAVIVATLRRRGLLSDEDLGDAPVEAEIIGEIEGS